MSIIQSIKNIFKSKEAQELREEIQEQGEKWQDTAREYAGEVVASGRSYVENVYTHTSEALEEAREAFLDKIDFDTFLRSEIRVGTILSVDPIEKSDKLLRLMVDVGEEKPRQIISGIAPYFKDPQSLVKRQAMFVTNLESKKIFGYESDGMIFAVNDDESFSILEPDTYITPGTRAS
ncbi:MAG: hypothetical protein ACKKL4_02400 [Patescibacteria group bacterium]